MWWSSPFIIYFDCSGYNSKRDVGQGQSQESTQKLRDKEETGRRSIRVDIPGHQHHRQLRSGSKDRECFVQKVAATV